jgi:hypothetical protein
VEAGSLDEARAQLPAEPAYPLAADLAEIIGASPVTDRR